MDCRRFSLKASLQVAKLVLNIFFLLFLFTFGLFVLCYGSHRVVWALGILVWRSSFLFVDDEMGFLFA